MTYDAKVVLGDWQPQEKCWACELVGYPRARVLELHVGGSPANRDDWEEGIRKVRWIAERMPPIDGQAWVVIALPDRIRTAVLVALIGLAGTLGGAALTSLVTLITNTCPAKLEQCDGELKQITAERNSCTTGLGHVIKLCGSAN